MVGVRIKQGIFYGSLLITTIMLFLLATASKETSNVRDGYRFRSRKESTRQKIIVITPTYPRPTRFADITRMATVLSQVPDVFWIVLEDRNTTVPLVDKIISRHVKDYMYFACPTKNGFPAKGWYQRSTALQVLKRQRQKILGDFEKGVIYFGDDDNAYDRKLFNDYIANVRKIGVWAVALVGGTAIESQQVNENGKVEKYRVVWRPERPFAIDMAGFAVDMDTVLNSNASFPPSCKIGFGAPEPCFLHKLKITKEDLEPFGYGPEDDHQVLVWHTKAQQPRYKPKEIDLNGFEFEFLPPKPTTTTKKPLSTTKPT